MCLKNFTVGPDVSLEMKRSETTKNLQKLDINSKKSLKKSVSDQQLTELEKSNSALHISLVDLINIFSDLETFLSQVHSLSTTSQVLKCKFLSNSKLFSNLPASPSAQLSEYMFWAICFGPLLYPLSLVLWHGYMVYKGEDHFLKYENIARSRVLNFLSVFFSVLVLAKSCTGKNITVHTLYGQILKHFLLNIIHIFLMVIANFIAATIIIKSDNSKYIWISFAGVLLPTCFA